MSAPLSHSYSSIKMFENCPKRYYHQRITKAVKEQPGTATVYGERVHKAFEDYLKGAAPLTDETVAHKGLCDVLLAAPTPPEIEREMTLTEALKPTGWWAADAWLRSKLDVLVKGGNTALVIDWKTGKRRPDFLQLSMFALQVFAHHPEVNKVKSMFVWVKTSETDHETYHREHADKMWVSLITRTQRIEDALEADVWPARPSGLCAYCPCKGFCEFAS